MWSIPVTIAFCTIRIGNNLNTLTMQFESITNLKERAVVLSLIPVRIGSGIDPRRIRIPGTGNSIGLECINNAIRIRHEFTILYRGTCTGSWTDGTSGRNQEAGTHLSLRFRMRFRIQSGLRLTMIHDQ